MGISFFILQLPGRILSLQGRKMMGLFYGEDRVYRLRLRGPAPSIYDDIAPAFDVLFDRADHDPKRPHIEYYRREGEVDCLVPISRTSQSE